MSEISATREEFRKFYELLRPKTQQLCEEFGDYNEFNRPSAEIVEAYDRFCNGVSRCSEPDAGVERAFYAGYKYALSLK